MSALRPSWTAHGRSSLVESLRAASEKFPKAGADGARIVHETRKELKRAASIARLFAPIVGAPAYAAIEVVDTARRQVGRARDLDILPGVLAGLKCEPTTRDALMRAIALERGKTRGDHAGVDVSKFTRDLNACADEVANWDLGSEDQDLLVHSLRLTYRAAKRLGRVAWARADADDLHELRSHVVDLGHQCALFEPIWPELISSYGAELHALRQRLWGIITISPCWVSSRFRAANCRRKRRRLWSNWCCAPASRWSAARTINSSARSRNVQARSRDAFRLISPTLSTRRRQQKPNSAICSRSRMAR